MYAGNPGRGGSRRPSEVPPHSTQQTSKLFPSDGPPARRLSCVPPSSAAAGRGRGEPNGNAPATRGLGARGRRGSCPRINHYGAYNGVGAQRSASNESSNEDLPSSAHALAAAAARDWQNNVRTRRMSISVNNVDRCEYADRSACRLIGMPIGNVIARNQARLISFLLSILLNYRFYKYCGRL